MVNNCVTTIKARQKFAKAHALGVAVPKITHVGWGEGGVDEKGNIIIPDINQKNVDKEFIKTKVEKTEVVENDLSVLYTSGIRASDTNVLNKAWSTLGLYDEEGDLIAVKNFTVKNIDEDTKIEITWKEKF